MSTPAMHLEAAGASTRSCDDHCRAPFTPKRGWARFCGSKCRNDFHGAEARKKLVIEAALEMYDALRLIAGTSCSNFTSGPGSCWSQPNRRKDAPFTAERWCDACIALAPIHHIKPPESPKALLENEKA